MKIDSLVYPHSRRKPAIGRILVANPASLHGDPFFDRSVVVLVDYGPKGASGLVLNRPAPVPLSHFMPDFPAQDVHCHLGGPLDMNRCCVMHRIEALARQEMADMAAGRMGDARQVERLLRHVSSHRTPDSLYRIFLGHAGWEPGQLEDELAQGHWAVGLAAPDVIFDRPDYLWERSVINLGPRWHYWLHLSHAWQN